MSAGYSGTPLARKLGIREGQGVWLAGAPPGLESLLDPLPSATDLVRTGEFRAPAPGEGGKAPGPGALAGADLPDRRFDVVLLFSSDAATLEEHFAAAVRRLRWDGGLWVCWPKKSSALHVDLAREAVREVGLRSGLVDNKVCAIDEDWSGLRFVVRKEDRPEDTEVGGPDV